MNSSMKAIRFTRHGGPEVLELIERPIPQPGPGEVLVQMRVAGISRPDHLMRTNTYPWTRDVLPFYPGFYGTGVVSALGEGVTGFTPGEPVYVEHPVVCGCYAEYKVAPAQALVPLPKGADLLACALLSNYMVAWSMLKVCFPHDAGKTLYISGAAGTLGSAIVQLAPLLGLRVIASASSPEKCEYLRELGADGVFQYTQVNVRETILSLTKGRGADIIMDQSIGSDFCAQLDYLAPMGTILIYNNTKGYDTGNIAQAMTDHWPKCPAVRAFSYHYFDDKPAQLQQNRQEVITLLGEGRITPLAKNQFSLEQAVEAHTLLDSGKFSGGIVLNISGTGAI